MGGGLRILGAIGAIACSNMGCSAGTSGRDPGDGSGDDATTAASFGGLDGTAGGGSGADGTDGAGPDAGVPVPAMCEDDTPGSSIELVGAGQGVHVGNVPALGLATFTLEAWIRWDGYGTTAASGAGGVLGEPIVTKGRGESDGGTIDCNYFFGIDASGHLVGDFEDMDTGLNHPAVGTVTIARGSWHHVAATYDGASWTLLVDGVVDTTVAADAMPRADSIQHSGIGTAYDSMGVPDGSFDGRIDEVRIWDRARTPEQIAAGMYAAPVDDAGLVGYWPLDTTDAEDVPELMHGFAGTREGASWVAEGRPRIATSAPASTVIGPGETSPVDATSISVTAMDPDADELRVEFWGRAIPEVEPFSVVVLPDTQYYCDGTHGGVAQMFYDQTQWIHDNAEAYDIRAVLHVGDLVDDGETYVNEWMVAETALSTLEDPLPGYDFGVPYAVAIGNHDQKTNSYAGQTGMYNMYFGEHRFTGRDYYGGHFGTTNDASYITFDAGGLKFLALFFEYDQPGIPADNDGPDSDMLAWARQVVAAHPDHLAIAVGHSCLVGTGNGVTVDTPFSAQGRARYEALRGEPSLRLMVCGHVEDEGRRTDVAASTVHSLLSDYQFDGSGGSGKLRLMTFRPSDDELEVQTYSPYHDTWYETPDSHYTLPIDLDRGGAPFELVGSLEHVASGSSVEFPWPELVAGTRYEWFVRVTDCTATVDTQRKVFTAQ